MSIKSFAFGVVAASSLAAAAHAEFLGFVAFVRQSGPNTVIDVFAGVTNPNDRVLNCYNRSISTSLSAGFVHVPGPTTRAWKPDLETNTRASSVDSFMTMGVQGGAPESGQFYASATTGADGNFTNWSSGDATTVPANAGWFGSPPTLPDNRAEPLVGIIGTRQNLGNNASAQYGVWCAHLVVANTDPTFTVNFGGQVTVRDGVTGAVLQQAGGGGGITVTPDNDGDGVPDASDACPNEAGDIACNGCPANICGGCGSAPDQDNDGQPDCQDNCPDVANPSQGDCDNDGQGDACEALPDCNGNGLPDACDISSGTSSDVDANGVPDSCQTDCNLNGLPDAWEISTGRVPDANADGTPDNCQGAVLVATSSGNLGSPSGLDVRVHDFTSLRFAETSVTITVDAVGDLNNPSEWITVAGNGITLGRLFESNGSLCPATPDRGTIVLTRNQFNDLLTADGSLRLSLVCPSQVDGTECKGAGQLEVAIAYVGIDPKSGDCNGNRRLDIIETFEGSQADCNNNQVPDSCDIARGVGTDCNGNGAIDACEITTTPAIDCNGNSVIDTCDIATSGVAIDCDSNGRIDSCQVVENPTQDCNSNGKPDSCDLAIGGATVDCNGDGRLDSCQVVESPSLDCNGNGKLDSCDVASGVSPDIDANGKPDECQTVTVPGQYASIQAAIDAAPASEMSIIAVAAGNYAGPIAFNGKPVIVRGANAASTVIDGASGQTLSVVRFTGGEPAIAALERVTVRGGATGSPFPGSPQFLVGGGIFSFESAASIRDCVIEQNIATYGAGAYIWKSTGAIERCVIQFNNAGADGGGAQLYRGSPRMVDCVVENNVCNSRGGGLHVVDGTPTITRTAVRNNRAFNVVAGVSWVPVNVASAFLQIDNCTITGNSAKVVQGGLGVLDTTNSTTCSLRSTEVCGNLPRPNVSGAYVDLGGNTICDCLGDLTFDGDVNGADLGILLSEWGACNGACLADIDGDGFVGGADLGLLLGAWQLCGG